MIFQKIVSIDSEAFKQLGFKEHDKVIVLMSDGSVIHGVLKYLPTTVVLKNSNGVVTDLCFAEAISHIIIEKQQAHLYDVIGDYSVTFKLMDIDSVNVLRTTPRAIFNSLKCMKSSYQLSMDIDTIQKTINIFPSNKALII